MTIKVDIHQTFAQYFKEKEIQRLAYVLSKKLSEGNICLSLSQYNAKVSSTEQISLNYLKESFWVGEGKERKAFILNEDKLYLQRYYYYETQILEKIFKQIKENDLLVNKEILLKERSFINKLFPKNNTEINWQQIAVIQSFLHHFFILTGGPGTGKTTTVAKILALMFRVNPQFKVALVAPTGKAAARLRESLLSAQESLKNSDASITKSFETIYSGTIHRLLKMQFYNRKFKYNKENPLDYDLIIVDESSMMGVSLMAKLLEAIPINKRLILLGDKNQLASVEAGSIFGDICLTQTIPNSFDKESKDLLSEIIGENTIEITKEPNLLTGKIIELQKSYRFDDNKGIGRISRLIINGKLKRKDLLFNSDNDLKSVFWTEDYQSYLFDDFIQNYEDYILEKDKTLALKKLNKVRVLCALQEGKQGVNYYNQKIIQYLKNKELIQPQGSFYHNQPIIITQNDYHLQLFNGDVGIIRYNENKELKAYFEGADQTLKSFDPYQLSHLNTVFAMTIHKSQGSEFDKVVVILPQNEDLPILTRELVYTAVTRAKTQVLLQAPYKVIEKSVRHSVDRASGITDRILKNKKL